MASGLTAPTIIGNIAATVQGSSVVIPTTTAVAPGDGVAVFLVVGSTTTTVSSIVDTRGNTYTASANSPATGSTRRSFIYVCSSTGAQGLRLGDAITITLSATVSWAALAVSLHAVTPTSAADRAPAAATGNSSAPSSSTGTLTQADELELGLIATDGNAGDGFVIGGGFTLLTRVFGSAGAVPVGLNAAYKIVSSTVGDTFSATITTRNWIDSVATYKASTYPDTVRLAGLIVEYDWQPVTNPTYPITGTATQSTSLALVRSTSVSRTTLGLTSVLALSRAAVMRRSVTQTTSVAAQVGRVLVRSAAVSQSQSVVLQRAVRLSRSVGQSTLVGLGGLGARVLAITQSTQARLVRQSRLTRTLSQAQATSGGFARGVQRLVSATQAQSVRLVKSIQVRRSLTGAHRISMRVSLGLTPVRVLRASVSSAVRLLRQVRLARQMTQGQAITLAGIPVQLRVLSTVLTRSLDLGRAISLTRPITQAQALVLKSDRVLERTLPVLPLLSLGRQAHLSRTLAQGTLVALDIRNVTPRYDVLVTTSVGQQLALSSAGAGQTAKAFVVSTRHAEFAIAHRSSNFAVGRRGVRFIVEER